MDVSWGDGDVLAGGGETTGMVRELGMDGLAGPVEGEAFVDGVGAAIIVVVVVEEEFEVEGVKERVLGVLVSNFSSGPGSGSGSGSGSGLSRVALAGFSGDRTVFVMWSTSDSNPRTSQSSWISLRTVEKRPARVIWSLISVRTCRVKQVWTTCNRQTVIDRLIDSQQQQQ